VRGEGIKKGEGQIWRKYFVFMYENRTVKLVKIVLRRGEEGIKKKDGGGEFN
jgi:hypothetical protein